MSGRRGRELARQRRSRSTRSISASWMRLTDEGNRWLTLRASSPRGWPTTSPRWATHTSSSCPCRSIRSTGAGATRPIGYFAPTSRFGTPHDFMTLIDHLHQRGIGRDPRLGSRPLRRDPHGLGLFDGTPLYEHPDPEPRLEPRLGDPGLQLRPPRRGQLPDRQRDLLARSVSHRRPAGRRRGLDALPRPAGARPARGHRPRPSAASRTTTRSASCAGSTTRSTSSSPASSRSPRNRPHGRTSPGPPSSGGLGFDLKWDLGWMHDTLAYMSLPPGQRGQAHHQLTFRMVYAFSENYILPLSHDDVSGGKGRSWRGCPATAGRSSRTFGCFTATCSRNRARSSCSWAASSASGTEWDHDRGLDLAPTPRSDASRNVALGSRPEHDLSRRAGASRARLRARGVRLDRLQRRAQQRPVHLAERTPGRGAVSPVCNFTPTPQHNYRVGVPRGGHWAEVLNSDAPLYGGSGQGNIGGAVAAPVPWHGQAQSLNLTLPPLALIVLKSD